MEQQDLFSTDEKWAIARRMKNRGRSFFQISERTGISEAEVALKLGSSKPKGSNWTEVQEDYILDNLHKTDAELAEGVSEIGPARTAQAVKTKRRELKCNNRQNRGEKELPWPSMKGDDEYRDRKFVRMVIREALRLELYRREAA